MDNLEGVKCVGFDADNTLYSTKKAAKPADMAGMKVLADKASQSPDKIYERFMSVVQVVKDSPDPKVRHRMNSYGLLAKDLGYPDAVSEMYEAFKNELLRLIEPTEGIRYILSALRSKRIKMFVITEDNRDMAVAKLTALKLMEYFSGIISSDDAGIMKPSPKYYEVILRDFRPQETLVIGDNFEKDLAVPQSLGMGTLLVSSAEDLRRLV